MQTLRSASRGAVLALVAAVPAAFAAYNGSLDTLVPAQGLQRSAIPGMAVAYARPGAALDRFDRVLLGPVEVVFRRDWRPYRTGSAIPLGEREREALRREVAQSVQQAFARSLAGHGLRLADAPGPGVARLDLRVVDVYLNNPWIPSPGRTRVLQASSGEMTLVADVRDAVSGEVLLRTGDWLDMRGAGRLLPGNDIRTRWDVDGAAQAWASSLADALRPARAAAQ